MAERIFGHTITTSNGKNIPTRWVAEQHILEDMGFIPSMQDWLSNIQAQEWMRPKFDKADQPATLKTTKLEVSFQ